MPWTLSRRPPEGTGPSSSGRTPMATWSSMWRSRTQGWGCTTGLKSGCSSRSTRPSRPEWEWGFRSRSRSSRCTEGPSGPRTTRRGAPPSISPCRDRRRGPYLHPWNPPRLPPPPLPNPPPPLFVPQPPEWLNSELADRASPACRAAAVFAPLAVDGVVLLSLPCQGRQAGSEHLLQDEVVHEEAASDVLLDRLADDVAVAPVGAEGLLVGLVHSQDHAGESAAPRRILDMPQRERAQSASMNGDLEIELVESQLASGHFLVCAVAERPVLVEQQLVDDSAGDFLTKLRGVVHPGEHVLDLRGGQDGGKVSPPDASGQLRHQGEIGIGRRHPHARRRFHSRETYTTGRR